MPERQRNLRIVIYSHFISVTYWITKRMHLSFQNNMLLKSYNLPNLLILITHRSEDIKRILFTMFFIILNDLDLDSPSSFYFYDPEFYIIKFD